MNPPVEVAGYISRETFIVERCRDKRVLDCGVIGLAEGASDRRVAGFPTGLHVRVAAVAREAIGIDSAPCTPEVAVANPHLTIKLARIEEPLDEAPFDVVVLGDILEHLSNPGLALDVLLPLVGSEIIVTCPNALGAPNYLRFLRGRFREGLDHVASHNRWTLTNLLQRHGYDPVEIYTAYDRDRTMSKPAFKLAAVLLRRFPNFGGTLVMVARPQSSLSLPKSPI
jgi:hypothetical protein